MCEAFLRHRPSPAPSLDPLAAHHAEHPAVTGAPQGRPVARQFPIDGQFPGSFSVARRLPSAAAGVVNTKRRVKAGTRDLGSLQITDKILAVACEPEPETIEHRPRRAVRRVPEHDILGYSDRRDQTGTWPCGCLRTCHRPACVRWSHEADAAVRGAVLARERPEGRPAALFVDFRTNAYAFDLTTGALLWKERVGRAR